MHTQDVRVTIKVNRELKESAEDLFDYLGSRRYIFRCVNHFYINI